MSEWFFWLIAFTISFGLNYFSCAVGWWFKTHKLTDIIYATTFIIVAIYALLWNKSRVSWVQILTFISLLLWAIRLGSYLLFRILKLKSDPRLERYSRKLSSWIFFWTLQSIAILILSSPFLYALVQPPSQFTTDKRVLGLWVLAIIGLIYEAVADWQKNRFYSRSQKVGALFMGTGLWHWSRHPNYFGDLVFWWSLWLFTSTAAWVNASFSCSWPFLIWGLSPLLHNLMLVFISGIPILERRSWKNRSQDPRYQQYVRTVPILIPIFGKRGLPMLVKKQLKTRLDKPALATK